MGTLRVDSLTNNRYQRDAGAPGMAVRVTFPAGVTVVRRGMIQKNSGRPTFTCFYFVLLFRVFLTSGKVVVRIRPPMRSPKTRGHKGPIQKLSHKKYSIVVLNIGKPAEWERHGTGRLPENEKNEGPPILIY